MQLTVLVEQIELHTVKGEQLQLLLCMGSDPRRTLRLLSPLGSNAEGPAADPLLVSKSTATTTPVRIRAVVAAAGCSAAVLHRRRRSLSLTPCTMTGPQANANAMHSKTDNKRNLWVHGSIAASPHVANSTSIRVPAVAVSSSTEVPYLSCSNASFLQSADINQLCWGSGPKAGKLWGPRSYTQGEFKIHLNKSYTTPATLQRHRRRRRKQI